jgi:hypothetical protein
MERTTDGIRAILRTIDPLQLLGRQLPLSLLESRLTMPRFKSVTYLCKDVSFVVSSHEANALQAIQTLGRKNRMMGLLQLKALPLLKGCSYACDIQAMQDMLVHE